MLTIYEFHAGELKVQTGKPRITEEAVWIDLRDPTPAEESQVETALKIDVPTHEEQKEIEVSDRLYHEDGAHFMTATLLYQVDGARGQDDAGQLHPRRYKIDHGALRRTARFRYFPHALQQIGERPVDRPGGAHGSHRHDRRPAGRFHRTDPGRGRGTIAFGLRKSWGRGLAPAPFRRVAALDRTGGRSHLQSAGERSLARAFADLPLLRRQRAQRRKTLADARPYCCPRHELPDRSRHVSIGQDHLPARRDARHDQYSAERHHQDFLGGGGRLPAADLDRLDLRHEFS